MSIPICTAGEKPKRAPRPCNDQVFRAGGEHPMRYLMSFRLARRQDD